MSQIYDVIVVGAGAIGAACARELARRQARVLVVERSPAGGGGGGGEAYRAAAGILAPHIEASGNPALLELGLASRDRHAELAAELPAATGIDPGHWMGGVAQVALDPADARSLARDLAWQAERGRPSRWLAPEEVRERWPWLAETQGALWALGDGVVDPKQLVRALLADAQQHRAVVVEDTARVIRAGHQVEGVDGDHGSYRGGTVVLAAGAWSRMITGLPRPLSVEPVRGQMIALPWDGPAEPAVIFGPDGYMVGRSGEVVAGSTMEYVGFDVRSTAAGLADVYQRTIRLCPDLAARDVSRYWTGFRPMTPDGLPILGPDPHLRGLWHATGHGRNGILLSAITGELIAQAVTGSPRPAPLDLTPFDPGRFWRW